MKTAMKQADRIPLEIKVDCYTISCIPLKSAVEKQIKELQDALSGCLQRKVLRSKEEMEAFIASGKIVLDTNAQTVEEIGNLRIEAQKLMAEFSGRMSKLRWQVGDLAKLLKQSGGTGAHMAAAMDFSSLDSEWENLSTKLGQMETNLEMQKENLKGVILAKIAEFESKAEAFSARWHEFKPKGMPSGDPSLINGKLEDDYRALQELREDGNKLCLDCEHFNMPRPKFSILDDVAVDIESTKDCVGVASASSSTNATDSRTETGFRSAVGYTSSTTSWRSGESACARASPKTPSRCCCSSKSTSINGRSRV